MNADQRRGACILAAAVAFLAVMMLLVVWMRPATCVSNSVQPWRSRS
jgi:hypothetical protein